MANNKKQIVYMHKTTGDLKICRTELEGQMLGKEWVKIQWTKNAKGEPVMRVNFGAFTMDISENGERTVTNGDGSAE